MYIFLQCNLVLATLSPGIHVDVTLTTMALTRHPSFRSQFSSSIHRSPTTAQQQSINADHYNTVGDFNVVDVHHNCGQKLIRVAEQNGRLKTIS